MRRLLRLTLPSLLLLLNACTASPQTSKPNPQSPSHASSDPDLNTNTLLNFESFDQHVTWQPATPNAPQPQRTSDDPHSGLWSLQAAIPAAGSLEYKLPSPTDARSSDTLTICAQKPNAPATDSLQAAAFLVDSAGHRVVGDFYPLTRIWQALPLDLVTAQEEGADLSQVTTVGLQIQPADPSQKITAPVTVKTDDWSFSSSEHVYVGHRLGPSRSFYVQRNGGRLQIGQVGRFEVTFHNRSGDTRPWLQVNQGNRLQNLVLGQPHTGLFLLDQDQFDALGPIHQTPLTNGTPTPTSAFSLQPSTFSWTTVWTSPFAAMVEVKQTAGPFDHQGVPACTYTWRFMVYQTGQIFAHVEWSATGQNPSPERMALALALDASTYQGPADARILPEQLLKDVYPLPLQKAFGAATLPHQMQTNAPVAMLAKILPLDPGNFWWAASDGRRYFGVGLPRAARTGPVNFVLLVNQPSALDQAAQFAQYLQPPRFTASLGSLDRNFPGDIDNDGLVEATGFHVLRLEKGLCAVDIDPQNRPVLYPSLLLANLPPAAAANPRRMLVTVDGTQLPDPTPYPDGSQVIQIPYTLSRPVHLEINANAP